MFSKKSDPIRILGSEAFGPRMTMEEVAAAFTNGASNPAIRAMGQIILFLREQCTGNAYSSLSGELSTQAALHVGAGNMCAELAQLLANLSGGKVSDTIKEAFEDKV